MNPVEDQVRAATRAQAATLRAVRPLRLTPAAGDAPEAAPPSASWARPHSVFRSPAWLAPIAAAAVVIVLALTLVIIKNLPNGRAVPPVAPTSSSTAGVPRYYAAPETTCPTCQSTRLVVGDTFTGAKLATFTPPKGTTFEAVAAAGEDRTFVADTVKFPFSFKTQHVTWYLLKITPGSSSPARLTRLPISAPPANARFETIAVSASGRELALAFQLQHGASDTTVLRTYSLPAGKLLHSWSTNTPVSVGSSSDLVYAQSNNGLSWIDGDRALSFTTASYTGSAEQGDIEHIAVRTLNATARGGDLLADSRVVWSMQAPVLDLDWPALTPGNESTCAAGLELPSLTANGKAVVCSTVSGTFGLAADGKTARYRWRLAWLAYALAAPKAARTLHAFAAYSTGNMSNASSSSVQWADPSGSSMIVAWTIASAAAPVTHFGLIAQGRLTPLPSPPGIALGTPPDIAW
jgi:hypothetical protein